jgi:hypothetical protein
MAGFFDDEEDDFAVKMIPKPGASSPNVMGEDQKRQQAQTRGALDQSIMDKRMAKSEWDDAISNIRHTVQDVPQEAIKKLDNYLNPREKTVKSPLPSGPEEMTTDALYERIMEERGRMLEQGLDPNSPEQMQKFQKLRQSLLKKSGV